ncbi:MAG TPA: hypothetical protein VM183_05595 [Burkholderiales bacterium]|nr:hypothetical protein [Burkholderiales bacterium]
MTIEQTLGSSTEDVLDPPVRGGRSLTTAERRDIDLSRIPGWASDLEQARRPGVPRDKAPLIGPETLYPPIPRQVSSVKIHKSTEHGRLTPVFGTSCPPSGLSGRLRDIGYHYSEGRLARWLTLMLADRVHMVEDIFNDLARGRIPNIPREMGIKSELRYNAAGFAQKVAIAAACTAAVVALLRMRRRR